MAQRTVRGSAGSAAGMTLLLAALGQPEEQQAVPAGAGSGARHRTERSIPPALVLETLGENLHYHGTIPIDAAQYRPGGRNPVREPAPPRAPRWPRPLPTRGHLGLQVPIVGYF